MDDRIAKAREWLVLDQPFFGVLLLRLKVVEDMSCKTFWVDGVNLGYNPAYLQKLTDPELRGVLCHEVLHVANGHCWRTPSIPETSVTDVARIWNDACDYAINPMVLAAKLTLPKGVLLDPKLAGSAEENFVTLMRREQDQAKQKSRRPSQQQNGNPSPQSSPQSTQGQQGDPTNQNPKGQKGQSGAPQPSQGQQAGQEASQGVQAGQADMGCGEVRQYAGPGVGAKEGEWKVAVMQAAKAAEMAGRGAGGLEGMLAGYAEASVDWRALLMRFAQDATPTDYSFTRPNRRYLHMRMYMPSLYEQSVDDFVVVRDSSGSVWSEIQAQFDAEIIKAFEDCRAKRLVVMDCDTRVAQVQTFERGDAIELKQVRGGGGTSFIAPFIEVEKDGINPAFLIYLTDMEGEFPRDDPGYPVLWASTVKKSRAKVPPFGDVIEITI